MKKPALNFICGIILALAGIVPAADFDDDVKSYSVFENTPTSTVIGKIEIKNVDAADVTQLVVSMAGKRNAIPKAEDLFYVPQSPIKDDISKIWLVFAVKDGNLLDHETADSVYTVIFTVQDENGLQDTIIREINL